MRPQTAARPSIFINVAAWVLLLLVALAGLVALFSAGGTMPQVFKLGKLELRTTSTAVIVMVIASLPLWMLLRYAVRGKVTLYENDTAWIGENAQLLEILTAIVGLAGICTLIWMWLYR